MRKADGSTYEPETLTCFQRSIDRHLTKDLHKSYSIIRDIQFASSREKLKAARKMLKKEGKGNRTNASEPLENADIEKMWSVGVLGNSTPEILQNTVWFLLTLHMGMRGRDEHYKLQYGDFSIQSTEDNYRYIEFNERDTKTRTGETSAVRAFKPKMWSTPLDPDKCPVRIFEKYLQKRPSEMCEAGSPFYLAVNYKASCDDLWYKRQRMGKDRIGSIMKRMACSAGVTGKKTNHSARKTMVTALTNKNVPETQIIQLTGHKNLQSLNSYKKASMEQQKDMSHVLSSYSAPAKTPTPFGDVNDQSYQSFFSGATLTGCTINVGLPSSNTQTQQNVSII